MISHGGGTTGQISQFTMAPERQISWAIFTNAGSGGAASAAINKKILNDYLGIEMKDPKPMQASEEQFSELVGKYSRPYTDIHLGVLGGRLVGQTIYRMGFPDKNSPPPPAPPPFTLDLIEEDRLMVLDGPLKEAKAEIIRKQDGSIGWLRVGRLHKKIA